MSDDKLYSLRLNDYRRTQLLSITGTRETILEAALRVALDCAPYWNTVPHLPQPGFTVEVMRIDP